MKVAIIGAGISGLTTAFFLKKKGAEVTVYEKNDYPGGTIRTKLINGFLVESGPNSTSETNTVIDEVVSELGIKEQLVYASDNARYRFIVRRGRLNALPGGFMSFITTPLWSPLGKMRIFLEPFIGKGDHEESIAEFVERRLGREILDYGINPFVAGVYAGNPSELSVRAAFPKLYALEEKYGGLIKGTIKGARERKKRPEKARISARLFSFKNGMGILPVTLANWLKDDILYSAEVLQVSPESGKFVVNTSSHGSGLFDAVVLSVPAYVAAVILRTWNPVLSDKLNQIKYPPVSVAVLGYRSSAVKTNANGFGFLVPEVENRKILGSIYSSSIFPCRAPEGSLELTTFLGGSRQPEIALLPDDEIIKIAHRENAELMGISEDPIFSYVSKWERAIPQYNIGHLEIVNLINRVELENKGFYICSNYRDGVSVADCLSNGKKTAERIFSREKI